MSKRKQPSSRSELVLFAHDTATTIRSIIRVKHDKRRGQVVVTFTRPRFKYHRKRLIPIVSRAVTGILLALGVGGIMYSLGPVVFVRSTASAESVQASRSTIATEPEKPVGLPRSAPVKLEIPDIALTTELIKLGKNDDGTLATPERYDVAGWYEFAPTPGEIGPAIIVGHVDSYMGAAVFYNLKSLAVGQPINVMREDGKTVNFKVDKVELLDQGNFPTEAVYGNIDYPGLRLITCGGTYNPLTNRYSHNTVVYASRI